MWRYVARRALAAVPVLLLASVLVFALVRGLGPDPARIRCGSSRDPGCLPRTRADLGLDRPAVVQYGDQMWSFVRGDWGTGLRSDRSVASSIGEALGETAQLVGWALLLSVGAAVAVGVVQGRRPGTVRDHTWTTLALAGIAVPSFWLGLMAIQVFTYDLQRWSGVREPILFSIPDPTAGGPAGYARELALPVLVLSVQMIAAWSRYQRASLIDEMRSDHIRTARAKGLSERRVVWKHGLRGSASALVTVVAIDAGALIGGVVVTERVFSRPGMGTLLLTSLRDGDTAMLIPWMMVVGTAVVVFNLVADVAYAALDPRVRVT